MIFCDSVVRNGETTFLTTTWARAACHSMKNTDSYAYQKKHAWLWEAPTWRHPWRVQGVRCRPYVWNIEGKRRQRNTQHPPGHARISKHFMNCAFAHHLVHDTSKNQPRVCLVCAIYSQSDDTVHSLLRCLDDDILYASGCARSCSGEPTDIFRKGVCLQPQLIVQLAAQTRCHESRTDAEENFIT